MPEVIRSGDLTPAEPHVHGCTHSALGMANIGSTSVWDNGAPALRAPDTGIHMGRCGPNHREARGGSPSVWVHTLAARRMGDATLLGQIGAAELTEGRPNVDIGG